MPDGSIDCNGTREYQEHEDTYCEEDLEADRDVTGDYADLARHCESLEEQRLRGTHLAKVYPNSVFPMLYGDNNYEDVESKQ